MSDCTEACWARPVCKKCERVKAPRGRSVPLAIYSAYCTSECAGYYEEPKAGHLWPGEEAQ